MTSIHTVRPTHEGDLLVNGHARVPGKLTVTGSLTVYGVLFDEGPDCRITVGGELTAAGVFVDGDLHVTGDIRAEVLYCAAIPDTTPETGVIHSRLIMEDDYRRWRSRLGDATHVDVAADDLSADGEVVRRLRKLLTPDVFDANGFDHRALFDLMIDGRPVFLPG